MTQKQWFKMILGGLSALPREAELLDHLEAEDRRTQEILTPGPLDAGLVDHLYEQADPLGLVLRGRLYLEDCLEAVVAKRFKHSGVLLQGRSYSFSVKMDILRAANYLDEPMYRDLVLISRIRNSFAHHLASDIGEYDLSLFTGCAGLNTVLLKFESAESRRAIALFLLRQIVLQLLVRLTTKHKLEGWI